MENTIFEQTTVVGSLFTILSEEVISVFENLPDFKKKAVMQLPEDQLMAWSRLVREMLRLAKRKADLEDAIVFGQIQPGEVVTANATLEAMNRTYAAMVVQEEQMIYPTTAASSTIEQPNPNYDRNARPGILSIRPSYKGTPPPPVVRMQKNSGTISQSQKI